MRPFASSCPSLVLLALATGVLQNEAPAQCSNPWPATSSTPGVLGGPRTINAATMWDRDGAGPLPPVAVLGGDFTIAGSVTANRIAAFDPATNTWSALGNGLGGVVRALLALPNGDLVAGGNFTSAGGGAAANIARFDGTTWWPLGTGIQGQVIAFALLPNGDLVAGGYFTTAGGVAANNIARWDGASWAPLGKGMSGLDSRVNALTVFDDGSGPALYAGGDFSCAGGPHDDSLALIHSWSCRRLGGGLGGRLSRLSRSVHPECLRPIRRRAGCSRA